MGSVEDLLCLHPEMREEVPVYDGQNRDRLLGYLVKPSLPRHHDRFQVAVHPPMMAAGIKLGPIEPLAMHIRSIVFSTHWRETTDGWVRNKVFTTDGLLADLMLVRDFRLPNETWHSAKERMYRAAYGG